MADDAGRGPERGDTRGRDVELGPRSDPQENDWNSVPELEVVRGPLPVMPAPGECLAVSAGGSNSFALTRGIRELMVAWGVGQSEQPVQLASRYIGVYNGRDVFAVRARSEIDTRGLADIYARRWRSSSTSRHGIAASACSCSRQEAPTNAKTASPTGASGRFPSASPYSDRSRLGRLAAGARGRALPSRAPSRRASAHMENRQRAGRRSRAPELCGRRLLGGDRSPTPVMSSAGCFRSSRICRCHRSSARWTCRQITGWSRSARRPRSIDPCTAWPPPCPRPFRTLASSREARFIFEGCRAAARSAVRCRLPAIRYPLSALQNARGAPPPLALARRLRPDLHAIQDPCVWIADQVQVRRVDHRDYRRREPLSPPWRLTVEQMRGLATTARRVPGRSCFPSCGEGLMRDRERALC